MIDFEGRAALTKGMYVIVVCRRSMLAKVCDDRKSPS
jgi:hypothetical protein